MVDNLAYFAFFDDAILNSNNVINIIISYSLIKLKLSTETFDSSQLKTLFMAKKLMVLEIEVGKINLNAG